MSSLAKSLKKCLLALPRLARSNDQHDVNVGKGAGRRGERAARGAANLASALLLLDLKHSAGT